MELVSTHTLPGPLPDNLDDALGEIVAAWAALILSGADLREADSLADAITRSSEARG